ncbi:biopolymer transporter ExbD [Aestuariibius sp. 2305UL40-4]|uniref:biopolymer transporter ExbD n=1 Tax=Aestuariibius violaceus TaxID=3234132 RepID=UPI00345EA424
MRKQLLPPPPPRIRVDVSLAIVNIVLLLILFFLATGQLLNPSDSDVDVAETTELPLDQLPSPILVVDSSGAWELDGRRIDPELLGVAVDELPEPRVLHILINREAPATLLLDVSSRPELSQVALRLVTLHRRPAP